MILNKNIKETDALVNINNDIYRIITIFNDTQELKQFLVNTGKNPLQSEKIDKDLRDAQICRVPLLPYDEEQGSIIVVTLINGDVDQKSGSIISTLAIDVFTPGNQWIINEGIRPLQIAHVINNLMKFKVNQTDGAKYRLTDIINAQLSDVLLGYRMIYTTVIDE